MNTLTTTQAAAYLAEQGIITTHYSVKYWCQRGLIPGAYRDGEGNRATWHIPVEGLKEALEARVIPPRPGPPRLANPSQSTLIRRNYPRKK